MKIPKDRTRQHRLVAADEIGQQALLFLVEEPGRLDRFLGQSGLEPAELHAQASSPDMLLAVLDHLLADESQLLVFAAQIGLEPLDVVRAHRTLAGPEFGDPA